MTRVMIAIPTHEMVSVRFSHDLARLYSRSVNSLMGQVELNLAIGTYVHDAREKLAKDAIAAGFTHVLWIDSDMRFPDDALLKLLRHFAEAVGINYSTRDTPGKFVSITPDTGERLITAEDSRGLEEVGGMGFGLLLMRRDVLTRTLERSGAPLFRYDWIPDRGKWVGEDFSFCTRARDAGVSFYVDHDLSKECAHVGAFEYRTEHAVPQMEQIS